jgi:hypothetical protein
MQIKGQRERTFRAGETFFEAPHAGATARHPFCCHARVFNATGRWQIH